MLAVGCSSVPTPSPTPAPSSSPPVPGYTSDLTDYLVECISVLVEVTRDHDHDAGQGFPGSGDVEVGQPLMPWEWRQDNDVSSQFHFGVESFINEKCAPFLGASVAEQPAP